MKKLYIFCCLGIALLISALVLVGCGGHNNNVESNMSDARYGVFDAKNDNISATFIYGERENPYAPDGKSNSLVNFGIISVAFKEKPSVNEFNFTLKVGDKTFSGKLEKSPFTEEYLADIGEQITTSNPLDLVIDESGLNYSIQLEKKSENWEIDYNKALKVGKEALNEQIEEMSSSGDMEYYLKIISDNKSNFGTYFWAFTAISSTGEKHTVIFSPSSPQILVKN